MVKILSQTGISLADTYDIEGSIAGVSELLTQDGIHLEHEMGGTIFAERFSTALRRGVTGAIAQNTVFAVGFSDLPGNSIKLLGVQVIVDVTGRVARVSVNVQDPRPDATAPQREFPVWTWDGTNTSLQRFIVAGVDGDQTLLNADLQYNYLPVIMAGGGQPQGMSTLVLRGKTTAFGAGTVTLQLLAYIAFAEIGGIDSYGLPLPGW